MSKETKYTGVVRRLDKLGRVVIPREYRKMHKIKVTDPLEIMCHDNGDIIVRKFDLAGHLVTLGTHIADELAKAIGGTVVLCDLANMAYVTGEPRSAAAVGTKLEQKTQSMITERKCFNGTAEELGIEGDKGYASMCTIFGDDAFGAFIVLSDEPASDWVVNASNLAARILGVSMQRY